MKTDNEVVGQAGSATALPDEMKYRLNELLAKLWMCEKRDFIGNRDAVFALFHRAVAASVQAVPQWISVETRLPEWNSRDDTPCVINGRRVPATLFSKLVLVTLNNDDVRTDQLCAIEGEGKPWFDRYRNRVTHWQDLPSPPVKEQGNG